MKLERTLLSTVLLVVTLPALTAAQEGIKEQVDTLQRPFARPPRDPEIVEISKSWWGPVRSRSLTDRRKEICDFL